MTGRSYFRHHVREFCQQAAVWRRNPATSCKVDFAPSKMNLQLSLSSPLKAMVTVDGKPRYNEAESNLYLDKLDINMKASNLIYKLSAPLVNRFLSPVSKKTPSFPSMP